MVEIFAALGLQTPDKISPNFVETRKMCKTRLTLVMEKYVKRFVYESSTMTVFAAKRREILLRNFFFFFAVSPRERLAVLLLNFHVMRTYIIF